MTLSSRVHLYLCMNSTFARRYKIIITADDFIVYRRSFRGNGEEYITIWKTSDKCIRLLRTCKVLGKSILDYQTFRSYECLVHYIDKITR